MHTVQSFDVFMHVHVLHDALCTLLLHRSTSYGGPICCTVCIHCTTILHTLILQVLGHSLATTRRVHAKKKSKKIMPLRV